MKKILTILVALAVLVIPTWANAAICNTSQNSPCPMMAKADPCPHMNADNCAGIMSLKDCLDLESFPAPDHPPQLKQAKVDQPAFVFVSQAAPPRAMWLRSRDRGPPQGTLSSVPSSPLVLTTGRFRI